MDHMGSVFFFFFNFCDVAWVGRFALSGDDSTEDLALMAKPFEKKV
jgi:hypothetical protein